MKDTCDSIDKSISREQVSPLTVKSCAGDDVDMMLTWNDWFDRYLWLKSRCKTLKQIHLGSCDLSGDSDIEVIQVVKNQQVKLEPETIVMKDLTVSPRQTILSLKMKTS